MSAGRLMIGCDECGWVLPSHQPWCPDAEPQTRVEWTGRIQVHQPIKTQPKPRKAS